MAHPPTRIAAENIRAGGEVDEGEGREAERAIGGKRGARGWHGKMDGNG